MISRSSFDFKIKFRYQEIEGRFWDKSTILSLKFKFETKLHFEINGRSWNWRLILKLKVDLDIEARFRNQNLILKSKPNFEIEAGSWNRSWNSIIKLNLDILLETKAQFWNANSIMKLMLVNEVEARSWIWCLSLKSNLYLKIEFKKVRFHFEIEVCFSMLNLKLNVETEDQF